MSSVRRVLSLSVIVLACLDALEAREGFGFSKRAVTMTRTLPPAIKVSGTRLRITTDDALRQFIIDAIVAGDPRFTESRQSDIELNVIIDKLDANETSESRIDYEYRQTGTRDEWSGAKGRYEKKPVYASVPVTRRVRVISGTLTARYEIHDARMMLLDSGSLEQKFHEKYVEGETAPSLDAVRDSLQRNAASQLATRIVPTTETVSVVLPKGSFENLIPLAESGEWDEYLRAVEAVAGNHNHETESYRQYALAAAKEAVAYSTKDHAAATRLLNEALQHCRNAAGAHVDTAALLKRIESSANAYAAWR
jgi:hypothetical protein